jgi:hypothetical protein
MALPDSYTQKPNAIAGYFEAILGAEAPERFSQKYLEALGFKSTNDRMIIKILKELGFIDSDGKPTDRYYKYLDKAESKKILAEGIRESYSDLFSLNTKANELSIEDIKGKLKSLYAGKKSDQVIGRIAPTFKELCSIADFTNQSVNPSATQPKQVEEPKELNITKKDIKVGSLQYHINIVLPATKDQAVYDAIFKSFREHLG